MAVIDIIVIAVLVVFAIIGMVKGFLNTLLSLFSTLASFGVAVFCAKPVSKFFNNVFNLVGFISSKLIGTLTGSITPFQTAETNGQTLADMTGAQIKEYFASDGLSFQERIFSLFIDDSATFEYAESAAASDQNVVKFIAEHLAAIISVVVSAIIVFILIKIAVLLLSKLFNAITKIRAINGIDRTLGLLVGVIKASFIICLTLGIFYLLANNTIESWIENSTVTKWIYNYVAQLVDKLADNLNLPSFITTLFPNIGQGTPTT